MASNGKRHMYGLWMHIPENGSKSDEGDLRDLIKLNGDAVDLMVEWNGTTPSMGQMKVLVSNQWRDLQYIVPDPPPGNDKEIDVLDGSESKETKFTARFQRGGEHAAERFQVRALPIRWLVDPPQGDDLNYVAKRDQDYEYASSVTDDDPPFTPSVRENGVQHATLSLDSDFDYELWVRLQSPLDPDEWLNQDPIVRTGGGGTGGSGSGG